MTNKSDTGKVKRTKLKNVRKWYLVTNHLNMMYMLAAGMVMAPAGFRGKHYQDSLSLYPGQVPLFVDDKQIPADVLDFVVSERKHLVPCIATFELSGFQGPVSLLKKSGKIQAVDSQPKRKNKLDIAMLIPAPLPLSALCGISFQTPEDMQAFVSAVSSVSNVGSLSHLIEVNDSLFKPNQEQSSLTMQSLLPEDSVGVSPNFGLALGGVLAMLYHIANHSELGLAVFRAVTQPPSEAAPGLELEDPVLAELPRWMNGLGVSEGADDRARLFWGVVQSLITSQEKGGAQSPIDIVLSYLKKQLDSLEKREYVPRLESLISDILGLSGLGGKTISELLAEHKGSLSRPLLLLCLREHCEDLLEFSDPSLTDTEFVLAGVLLGVRDSWLQLPSQMRVPELVDYVAYRMADSEHRKQGDGLCMDSPDAPVPLREYFRPVNGAWSEHQCDQAVLIARKCHWNDCLSTVVTLTDCDLPDSFKRHGLQLVLPGSVTILEELDKERFLGRLGQWPPIDPMIESDVRAWFKSQQEETANHADDSQSANRNE